MRKLVLILLVSIAVITFIRAFDNHSESRTELIPAELISPDGIIPMIVN